MKVPGERLLVPNSYQKPNFYTDRLMHLLDGGEWKTLDYAIRRTFGFGKEQDRISVSQFMDGNGRVGANGELLEHGTGLSRTKQIRAIKSLEGFGVLIRIAKNDPKRNEGALWELQLDESEIDMNALLARHYDRKAQAEQRTKKARTKLAKQRDRERNEAKEQEKRAESGDLVNDTRSIVQTTRSLSDRLPPQSVTQTTPSLSDRLPPICGTDYPRSVGQTHRNPVETQIGNQGGNPDDPPPKNDDVALNEAWTRLRALCDTDHEAAMTWKLTGVFCEETTLSRPGIDDERGLRVLERGWWSPVLSILREADGDDALAARGMRRAIADIDGWKPEAIATPGSVEKTAKAMIAAEKRGTGANEHNGNGYNGHVMGMAPLEVFDDGGAVY